MKIIHTADWHIGKIVNQVYMTEDQEYALKSLVTLLAVEKPDVLIIAGDIYDRAVPPVEAVELLDKTLSTILLELEIPVLLIAGNHDSPDRLSFGSKILQARGLHIAGRFIKNIQKVTLEDQYGPVNFYLVPYAPPAEVKAVLERKDITDHDLAMAAIIDQIKKEWQPQQRNVLVTHAFVCGNSAPELSDSEKPLSYASVGGIDNVDAKRFEDFTYTALGHLHGPQNVNGKRIRYSGSLLKYSFSEVNQQKSVSVVNIDSDGNVECSQRLLAVLRDFRCLKGELKALLDPAVYNGTNLEDYLHITLTDQGELLEPMAKLRTVYPHVLALEFESSGNNPDGDRTSAGADYTQKTELELFRDFYCNITGKEFSAEKERIIHEVIRQIQAEERGA
jgi:exonuclease SbcD